VRLFEYGQRAHDVMRRAVAPVDSRLQWLPRAEHLLDARG